MDKCHLFDNQRSGIVSKTSGRTLSSRTSITRLIGELIVHITLVLFRQRLNCIGIREICGHCSANRIMN